MVLNSVCWRCFHVSLLIGYRCQAIGDYFKPNFLRAQIQTLTPEADVGPFLPLQNVVWHSSRLNLWGKKRQLYLILAHLVSSFQNLHECDKKTPNPNKPKCIPYPSAYTGTGYLVATRLITCRLGHECSSLSTLLLHGPKSGTKCYFSLFLPSY